VLPERFEEPTPIGRGGQGETFRAFDRQTERHVAIKVLTLAGREWKDFELFERECAVLRTLDHPGVPAYYEHFADEAAGRWFLVMELIEGQPLSEDLAWQRRRTEAQLLGVLEGVLDILSYLHALRPMVIHRDIKPGNLIERDDGRVALVDFGGVTHALRNKGGSTMIGTFGYMAPEQLYGRAGPHTDLYALGATIAALAGGTEAEELPRKGMDIDVASLVGEGPLRRALLGMCRSDLEQRAASVEDVRRLIAEPEPGSEPKMLPAPDAALVRRNASMPVRRRRVTDGMTKAQRRGFAWSLPAVIVMGLRMGGGAGALVLSILYTMVYVLLAGVWRGYATGTTGDDA